MNKKGHRPKDCDRNRYNDHNDYQFYLPCIRTALDLLSLVVSLETAEVLNKGSNIQNYEFGSSTRSRALH